MMCAEPRSAATASARSRPCVSEMTPTISSRFSVLRLVVLNDKEITVCQASAVLVLHVFHELADADNRAPHCAATDFANIVASGHTQRVEASIEGFEHGLGRD